MCNVGATKTVGPYVAFTLEGSLEKVMVRESTTLIFPLFSVTHKVPVCSVGVPKKVRWEKLGTSREFWAKKSQIRFIWRMFA